MPRRQHLDGRWDRAKGSSEKKRRRTESMINGLQYLARQMQLHVSPFKCGPMNIICHFCQALRFPKEKHNCCHNGEVRLPRLSTYPGELKALFIEKSVQSRNFKENIRQYNSALAFASFGANIAVPPVGRGPHSFRIHGQIYHKSGSLHPSDNADPLVNCIL